MKDKACELCNQQAFLYCPSDAAYLCWNCDATVHGANFLVARHIRHRLCSKCNCFTGIHISGATICCLPSTCRSCSPENPSDDAGSVLSDSSESCTTAPKKTKARRTTTEGRMRSCSSSVTDDASPATKKRRGMMDRWRRRVAAATSFWLGLRFCGDATYQNLSRLEAISGVPAKLILAAHAKLARVFSHCRELQEGWDES
ncbi:B-box-type zinc finger [Sesbania bispinosa]|nr:B-box-type zinc finger [Sesbania bispinosa]